MRKALMMTAAVLAAVIFFLLVSLPPRPRLVQVADAALAQRTIAGAYHVHSVRSDGSGNRETIAAAAARAGLKFVIITDHGDGTRVPDAPAYIAGVLCIDAVEISTTGGHYVALGLGPAPYPLGGQAAAVVEDVARLGGFGFAAHPDSTRTELAWSDWTLPFDGIEWVNADSEWRNETRPRLARVVFDYLVTARTRARVHSGPAGRQPGAVGRAHGDAAGLVDCRPGRARGAWAKRRVPRDGAIDVAARDSVLRGQLPLVQHACRARAGPERGRS